MSVVLLLTPVDQARLKALNATLQASPSVAKATKAWAAEVTRILTSA